MSIDTVSILVNISHSLAPVQALIKGAAYLIGFFLMIRAIAKLRSIADSRASGGGHGGMFVPMAYIVVGTMFLYLPSSIETLTKTAFGTSSILGYSKYNPYSIYDAMKILIQTAGLIWFVRGSLLLAHASEPGVQEGPKGLAFLCAGVFAINFEGTISVLNYIMDKLLSWSDKLMPGP